MKRLDSKKAKKFIAELKRLNKSQKFEVVTYKGVTRLIDNINMSKLKFPENWSYDVRIGFVYKATNSSGVVENLYMSTFKEPLKEIGDIYDLQRELQGLNPTTEIYVDYSSSEPKIKSSTSLEGLNYPDGFYYNSKNGITNKHNTTGAYSNFSAEQENIEIEDVRKLLSELQILNPNANIKVEPMAMLSGNLSSISSSIPVDKLILPQGFEYNEKNGITNKRNTTSGSYISCEVEYKQIKDAYDLAREIQELNQGVNITLSNNNGQVSIATNANMVGVVLPKGFVYKDGQIISNANKMNVTCEVPKSIVESAKEKIEQTVAKAKSKANFNKTMQELNPMEFKDVKAYFDKYSVGIKDGEIVAIDRKTNKVIEDIEVVSRVQFASSWVEACGKDLSLSGREVFAGIDERQYEYAFNEGAEATFNSLLDNIRFSLGGKVHLDELVDNVKTQTGYKYSNNIVESLLKEANPKQLQFIKSELSKSAQAMNMQNSMLNPNK